MSRVAILLLAATAALGQSAPVFVEQQFNPRNLTGRPFPKLTLVANDGRKVDMESFRGHPVLIHLWATWCGNCAEAILVRPTHQPSDLIEIGLDFDRDPNAAADFLSRHRIPFLNFHDDGSINRTLHLYQIPYAGSILIDADGKVVFAERAIYREELRAALASLGSQYADPVPFDSDVPPDLRGLAARAVAHQDAYFEAQTGFSCRYKVTVRDHYESGMSTHAVEHTDEVLPTEDRRLISRMVEGDPAITASSATETYPVWHSPIFAAVLAHSILSNARSITARPKNAEPRHIISFSFRGDPTVQPANDTERIAQALEGTMSIDMAQPIFEAIDAITAYDVVDDRRFLIESALPVISLHAAAFHGTPLPSEWSIATWEPVALSDAAKRQWLGTLTRVFGLRDSCKQYEVHSRILAAGSPQP